MRTHYIHGQCEMSKSQTRRTGTIVEDLSDVTCNFCRKKNGILEKLDESSGYKVYETNRDTEYKKKYGIGVLEYEAMLEKQGGVCALCKKPEPKRRLSVDHDHVTGRVRGLLCWPCNSALGQFMDNQDVLLRAISYLKHALECQI